MSFWRFLYLTGVAAALAGALRLFAFEGIYIASASMEPTLPVGTHVLLDKLTYRVRSPRRGEIIVFTAPVPPHEQMVKRAIAIAGDSVELRKKTIFLNGQPLEERYVQHTRIQESLAGDNLGPLNVPHGHVFVLGDNRDESNDATTWKDPISGKPIYFVPLASVQGILRGFY